MHMGKRGLTRKERARQIAESPRNHRKINQIIVPHEDFVRYWRRSRSIHDMISYTALGYDYIYARAMEMRAMGVELKPWPKRNRLGKLGPEEVEALNKLKG